MRIDTERTDSLRERNDDDLPRAAPPASRPTAYQPPAAAQDHAQREMLAFVLSQRPPAGTTPSNDNTLVVAMTKGAADEGAALATRARGHVTMVVGSTSSIVAGADASGRTFDLSNRAGIDGFVATLGLSADASANVANVIFAADSPMRDELSGIAKAWAPGERGDSSPSRLVLSGHGSRGGVYSPDQDGHLLFADIAGLAKAMPRAAARVEDVFISACYQAQPGHFQTLIDGFPNLRTAQGYEGPAPERDIANVLAWEAATRGHAEHLAALPQGGSWTRGAGFSNKVLPLDVARAEVRRLDVFDSYFRGEASDPSPGAGKLHSYYVALNKLSALPQLPAAEKQAMDARIDQTVLLRHYPDVRRTFARELSGTLRAGYAALGQTAPDFARLARKGALDAIAATESRAATLPSTPAEVAELLRVLCELRDLKNDEGKKDVHLPH